MTASAQYRENSAARAAFLEDTSFPKHLAGFLNQNSSWNTRHNSYQRMREGVSQATFHLIIGAAVELSILAHDKHAADDLLLEATDQLALYESRTISTAPAMRVNAALLRSNIPLLVCMFAEREHPAPSVVEEAYTHLGNELVATQRDLSDKRKDINKTNMQSYVGIAAEAATLVRLQKFATEEVGEGWTPATALLSQKRNAASKNGAQGNWDISIYTDLDDLHAPAHKIQLQWGDNDRQYDEDISVVNAKYDLLLPGERVLSLGRFIRESCEIVPPNVHRFRPAARTELLLTAIE